MDAYDRPSATCKHGGCLAVDARNVSKPSVTGHPNGVPEHRKAPRSTPQRQRSTKNALGLNSRERPTRFRTQLHGDCEPRQRWRWQSCGATAHTRCEGRQQ